MTYKPTIGLEIHAELKTQSKMFCDCFNDPDQKEPNVNICPVCLGHPGSLPVINKEAVDKVIKAGLALDCRIPETAKFDRKSYFYPDLPKGYQISQYDEPLAVNGRLEINNQKIRIKRIHLEEDTGKLIHPVGVKYSLIDFNRAGVPLMELVSEPDFNDGNSVRQFCEELQLIFRYLEISQASIEKGQMRCEVNISLSKDKKLGTKVEIKNLNSFRSVERAIDYEIKRQAGLLAKGEKIVQETRGWDENKQTTFSQRLKEEAQDYRYFPEPDLPPLSGLLELAGQLSVGLPELPQAKRKRLAEQYKLPLNDIDILTTNKPLADYFEQVVSELDTWLKIKSIDDRQPLIKLTTNYFLTELQRLLFEAGAEAKDCKISAENFAEFITLIHQKEISSSAAQSVLKEMFATGSDPSHIIDAKKLRQVSDEGSLEKIVKQVIGNNQRAVQDYKVGKGNALQFLVGQVMAVSKGQANPEVAAKLIQEKLDQ